MNKSQYIANAILWAAAIIVAAATGAPAFFTIALLPTLAACALLSTLPRSRFRRCR
jgi:hypothetical protein